MPSYFIGKDVKDRELTRSPHSAFDKLVNAMVSLAFPLAVTRDQYHAMAKDEQSRAKQVGYMVACTYPDSPHIGRGDNVGDCNLVFLDVDAKDGVAPAAPFVKRPELLLEMLPWSFCAYRTISSTPEAPRMRVMVDATAIPPSRYADAARTVARALGLPHVTLESTLPSQPMFRASVFADQDLDLEHPLLAKRFDGPSFTVDDICASSEDLPGVMAAGGKARAVSTSTGDSADDFLLFLAAPVPQVTLQVAKEALAFLEPDCPYPEWIEVAFALRHQFRGDDVGDAYSLFDEWSEKGTKYAGQDGDYGTETKWKYCATQPRGRAPITIRSLLKRAVERGWDGGKVRQACFDEVHKWLLFKCDSASELVNEGIKRIAAAPLLNNSEEDMLVNILMAQVRSYGLKVSAAKVNKDLRRCKDMAHVKKESSDKAVQPWANGIVYVGGGINEFFKPATRQKWTPVTFDNANSRWLLPTPEDLQKNDKPVDQASLHNPLYKPSIYLLNHVKCQVVDDYDYDPANPDESTLFRDGSVFVNTYRKPRIMADRSQSGYAEEWMIRHLRNLFKEPEFTVTLMDWFAFQVQNPGVKVRWAPLIQGTKGIGKTFLVEVLRAVLGAENIITINSSTLKQGWSEWVKGHQIVFIEEIRAVGHNRHDIANMLKEPVTNTFVTMNERRENTRTIPNRTNYLACTNYHNPIPIDPDERRWWVIKSQLQCREDILTLEEFVPGYFQILHDMVETHAGGIRWLLENHTISTGFRPNHLPAVTRYMLEMVSDTENELMSAIKSLVADASSNMVTEAVISFAPLMALLEHHGMRDLNPAYVTTTLREAGYEKLNERPEIEGRRHSLWVKNHLLAGRNPVDHITTIHHDEEEWW